MTPKWFGEGSILQGLPWLCLGELHTAVVVGSF